MIRPLIGLLLVLGLLPAKSAQAYPEMVRHGYTNCSACHASPSGGGILTPYGRSTSQAVLSMVGREQEALPAYGLVPLPEQFQIQSFVKGVQFYQDTPKETSGDSQFMQADLEASAVINQVTVVASGGVDPSYLSGKPSSGAKLLSREHYVMVRPTDSTSIRAGKFQTDYGIRDPNHTIATRQGIGFGPYSESYGLEAGFQGEKFSGAATAVFWRPSRSSITTESGGALTGAYSLAERFKLGASFFQGYSNGSSRQVAGPYGILGFTERFYLLTEYDWEFRHGANSATRGNAAFVSYNRLGYEVVQGLHVYLMQEYNFQRLGDPTQHDHSVGPGLLFFPRPHFEFQAQISRDYDSVQNQNETSGLIVGSFYL